MWHCKIEMTSKYCAFVGAETKKKAIEGLSAFWGSGGGLSESTPEKT
jgi:hypothetical protein